MTTPRQSVRRVVDRPARRARIAVSALFFTNGALFANALPRFPEIKAAFGLDSAAYGVAIAAFPAGSIAAGLAAAALIRRFGSARVAVGGTMLTAVFLMLSGFAPTALLFPVALFVAGASDAVTDVAENTHGLRIQRRYGRSIINSFHAIWSLGAAVGGAMAAGAIALHIPVGVHLAIAAALFSVVALFAYRLRLPGPDGDDAPAAASEHVVGRGPDLRTIGMIAALSLIAMAGIIGEDAGNSWATLYLGESLGAPAAVAPVGFIALVGTQFIGRLLGDPMVDRFGQRAVAVAGGLITTVAMGLALAFPSIPGTIAGFAVVGFGVATLIPAAMHAADELPGVRPGAALTVVSWLMRVGMLVGPPIVGIIAESASLRAGLLIAPVAGIVAVVFAGALHGRGARD